MASKSNQPSVPVGDGGTTILGDLNPLTTPLNYIKSILSYFQEKEQDFHRSFKESFHFHKIIAAPEEENDEVMKGDNPGNTSEVSNPTKFKAFKIKVKMLFKNKKVSSNRRQSSIADNSTDSVVQPLTVTLERLQDLHRRMENNISELQLVMHITTVEEQLIRTEKEVIDDIDCKLISGLSYFFSFFLLG